MTNEHGCYVEGWHGWRGVLRVIELAQDAGMIVSREDAAAMTRYDHDDYASDSLAERDNEIVVSLGDDAEEWLNEHAAEDGCSWFWSDGEFFYGQDEDEEYAETLETLARLNRAAENLNTRGTL